MAPCESFSTLSYSHFAATMSVSLAVCVKVYRDFENWVRRCSRSFKMTPFDRPYTTFYRSAIVSIALYCTIFELLGVE